MAPACTSVCNARACMGACAGATTDSPSPCRAQIMRDPLGGTQLKSWYAREHERLRSRRSPDEPLGVEVPDEGRVAFQGEDSAQRPSARTRCRLGVR
eukprot:549080-Pleurochrysis_carterae.AAC.1